MKLPTHQSNPDSQIADWAPPQPRSDWQAQWLSHHQRAVLFDLDGTLLDTAADLGAAANALRGQAGLPPMPLADLRPFSSKGARGLIQKALGVEWNDPRFEGLRNDFLRIYEANLADQTIFMPGLEAVVDAIEAQGLAWGIVTNKFERFTQPLIEALGLDRRMAVCISGDTTAFPKPHPAPLQHAVSRLALPAQAVVYVGDDYRDIVSGFHAGCFNIAAAFGFCSSDRPVADWGADATAHQGEDLLGLLHLQAH